MKVFLVDDSAIIRERLVSMLSEIKGVEIVGEAKNAHDALEDIEKLKPDAVILDIRMPGGNGIDVLEKIKEGRPKTQVIMFTNYLYPQYRKRCMELGADFFFDKSNEFEKVTGVIQKMMGGLKNES